MADDQKSFTGHLLAMRAEHDDLRRLYEAALQEIADLRAQNNKLLSGEGISVLIAGRAFPLVLQERWNAPNLIEPEVRGEVSQKLAAVSPFKQSVGVSDGAFLNDQALPDRDTAMLSQSLVAFRD